LWALHTAKIKKFYICKKYNQMKELSKEELELLQGLVTDYNNVKIRIADTFIAQDALLKEIESMKAAYIKEEKKLLEKYGDDAVINVQTGKVTNGDN
jgi:hypothetical protein